MSEGIKYDQGKLRLAEMITDFAPELEELCKVWEFGANKYEKSNWKLVDNGYNRYSNALIRHLIAEDQNLFDDESKLLHAAHIAFNALARMHFILLTLKYGEVEELKEDKEHTAEYYVKLIQDMCNALGKECNLELDVEEE